MAESYTRKIYLWINGKEINGDIKTVRNELAKLRNMQSLITDQGSKEYKDLGKQIRELDGIVKKHNEQQRASVSNLQKFKASIKNLLPVASLAAGAAVLGKITRDLFNLSKTMQGEARKNSIVLGDSLGYIEEQADLLSKKMGVTNHQFTSMVANTADLLVPLDFAREKAAEMAVQVQSLAGALDEWTAGQFGVADASETLNAAMLGEMERLKKYGIAIRQDSEEFKELVKQKYAEGAASDAQAKAMATLELIMKKSKDAQAAYNMEGNKLIRLQKSAVRFLRQTKESFIGLFEIKPEEQIRKERDAVNQLVFELMDANTQEERRKTIVDQLKTLAPDIVSTLDDEKKATKETADALRDYNQQMINRIILTSKQEEYQKAAERAAKITDKIFKQGKNIASTMQMMVEKSGDPEKIQRFNEIMLEQGSILDKINKIQEEGIITIERRHEASQKLGFATNSYSDLNAFLNSYDDLVSKEKERIGVVEELRKEMEDFAQSSGLQDMLNDNTGGSGSGGSGGTGGNPKDDPYKADLAKLENWKESQLNVYKQAYAENLITKQEYLSQSLTLDINTLQKQIELARQYGESTTEIEGQLLDKRIELKEGLITILDEMRQEVMKADEDLDKQWEDEFEKWMEQLQDDAQTIEGTHDDTIEILKEGWEDYAATAIDIIGAVGSFFEASMERELKAAGDNEAKKELIRKKYANREKAIRATEVAIEGIVEIARINSNAGVNADLSQTLRILLTASAVARTAGNIAAILAKSYDVGGFTKTGSKYTPAGIVHENEYVVPQEGVMNPNLRPLLDAIEAQRVAGQLATFTLPGYAAGGKVAQTAPAAVAQDPAVAAALMQNTQVMQALLNQLLLGIKADIVFQEFEDAQTEVSAIRSKSTIR